MLPIAGALVLGIVCGLLTGGSVRRIGDVQFRWWVLALVGLALQFVPVPSSRSGHLLGVGLLLGSYGLLLLFVALNVGPGYGGDPDWGHGQWKGPGWVEAAVYELTDPAVAGRIPFGVLDHVARATCDGAEGSGIFEHASIGRHDPSGFADLGAVAR